MAGPGLQQPPVRLHKVSKFMFVQALINVKRLTGLHVTAHQDNACPCCGRETPVIEYRRYDGLIVGYKMLETEDFYQFYWLVLR